MPLNRQFGFVFSNDQNPDELIRTIAHEPGHGAFRLRHTFSEKNLYIEPKYSTDNLMDYTETDHLKKTRLHKYQWDECHDWDLGLNWGEGEEEGELIGGNLFMANLIEYISQIRQGNKDKKEEIPIKLITGIGEYGLLSKVKLGNKEFSYIKMVTKGFNTFLDAESGERPAYKIKPNEVNKTNYTENGLKYVKYSFHEMLTKKNGIPYADTREPLGQKRIEVCVKEQESIPFENYYLNRDLPLAGDPLIIMDIVGTDPTNKSNKIGGTYGCKRYTSKAEEQNCITWSQNIENFPSVSGKNKVHDGVDLRAEIETSVYAMFDGVAQILYSTSLGNYVLIKSNVSEPNLLLKQKQFGLVMDI